MNKGQWRFFSDVGFILSTHGWNFRNTQPKPLVHSGANLLLLVINGVTQRVSVITTYGHIRIRN